MPRYSRKSKRRSAENLDLIDHLRTGNCLGCIIKPAEHDDDDVKAAWAESRDVVMADWIREHPGSRPWAWWEFEAPGRRERTDGGVHPFDNKARTLHVAASDNKYFWQRAYRLWWGYPCALIMPWDRDIKASCFEEDWEYLHRHGLLVEEDSP